MKFIIGTKQGMTQVFRGDRTVVPVTRVQSGPCVITQVKTKERDGVSAVQVGFGEQKAFRINKAQRGHLKDLTVRHLKDFRTEDNHGLNVGDTFSVAVFDKGEKIQVVGTSKGKGFQGVVKRHGFHGSPKTHGHKDQLRMPGSLGAGGVQRVFKGKRMGGHMGDAQVTVKNLEIVEVHPETNEIFVKGAVPGARGGLLFLSTPDGNIEIITQTAPVTEEAPIEQKVEEPKEEISGEDNK